MWQLMLLLVVGEGEPARTVVSEHATHAKCVTAAHQHRAAAIRADTSNTMRVYWCAAPPAPSSAKQ